MCTERILRTNKVSCDALIGSLYFCNTPAISVLTFEMWVSRQEENKSSLNAVYNMPQVSSRDRIGTVTIMEGHFPRFLGGMEDISPNFD